MVHRIRGYVDRHCLVLTVGQIFVAAEKTLDDQTALRWSVPLANNISIRPKVHLSCRQVKMESLPSSVREVIVSSLRTSLFRGDVVTLTVRVPSL